MRSTIFFPHCPICGMQCDLAPREIIKDSPTSFDFSCDHCGLLFGVAYVKRDSDD